MKSRSDLGDLMTNVSTFTVNYPQHLLNTAPV